MKSMREVRTTGRCHGTHYYTTGTTYYRYRIYYRYTVQLYDDLTFYQKHRHHSTAVDVRRYSRH
eukprot:COSAG01_NODE_4928_length_4613_cov_24.277741_1_plen_64_part_10